MTMIFNIRTKKKPEGEQICYPMHISLNEAKKHIDKYGEYELTIYSPTTDRYYTAEEIIIMK